MVFAHFTRISYEYKNKKLPFHTFVTEKKGMILVDDFLFKDPDPGGRKVPDPEHTKNLSMSFGHGEVSDSPNII